MGPGALRAPTRSVDPAAQLVKHLSLKRMLLSPVSGSKHMVCMTSREKYSVLGWGVPWPFFSCSQKERSALSNGGPLLSPSPAQREVSSHLLVVSYIGKYFMKGGKKIRQKVKANAVCGRKDYQSHVLKWMLGKKLVLPTRSRLQSWSIRWSRKFSLQPCSLPAFPAVPVDMSATGGGGDGC